MNAPQGSAEWLAARAGCLTASAIADMMARTKTGWAASRDNLRAKLVAERMTGVPQEAFMNEAMRWGVEHETFARAAYEVRHGVMVDQVGLILHPEIQYCGASPDGLVAHDGLWEGKCPNTSTHIEYLLSDEPPKRYVFQVQWQMAVTRRQWCDLTSFDPRMPEYAQMKVWRINRDDNLIKALENEARAFLQEVADLVDKIKACSHE